MPTQESGRFLVVNVVCNFAKRHKIGTLNDINYLNLLVYLALVD